MADILLKIIILTIGILGIMESVIIMIIPKQIMRMGKDMLKNTKTIRNIAITEFIVAIAITVAALLI